MSRLMLRRVRAHLTLGGEPLLAAKLFNKHVRITVQVKLARLFAVVLRLAGLHLFLCRRVISLMIYCLLVAARCVSLRPIVQWEIPDVRRHGSFSRHDATVELTLNGNMRDLSVSFLSTHALAAQKRA